jgi:O-antigen/teichoic acid export membrane protein
VPAGEGSTDEERESGILLRGSSINLAGGAVAMGAGLVVVSLLSRNLGAGGVGAFLTALAVLSVVSRVCLLGADTGLVRFVSSGLAATRATEVRRFIFAGAAPGLTLTLGAAVALGFGADSIARLVADHGWQAHVATYLTVGAWFLLPAALLSQSSAVTRGLGTMVPGNLTENVLRPILQVALVAGAIYAALSASGLAFAYWMPTAIAAAVAILVTGRRLSWMPVRSTPPRSLVVVTREYWAFTGFRAIAVAFAASIEWLDVLLLGALSTTAIVGIYAAASRYLGIGRAIQYAVAQALSPQISRLLTQGARAGAATAFETASAASILLAWPFYILVFIYAPTLLDLLGPEFETGAAAVRILALAWMFGIALGPVDAVLLMAGKSWLSMVNLTVALALNIGLNLLLIPTYGATGAAVAWFGSVAANNILPLLQVRRFVGLTPFGERWFSALAITTLSFGIPTAISRALLGSNLASLSFALLIGGGSFLIAVRTSSRLGARAMLRAAMRRIGPSRSDGVRESDLPLNSPRDDLRPGGAQDEGSGMKP